MRIESCPLINSAIGGVKSSFIKCLKKGRVGKTIYLTVAGIRPNLLSFYRLATNPECPGKKNYTPFFSIPDILGKIVPLPKEMKENKGDGMVSVESARIPWADENYVFKVNHASILFDIDTRRAVLDFIERSL